VAPLRCVCDTPALLDSSTTCLLLCCTQRGQQ